MDCAAAEDVRVDEARVEDGEMMVSLSVPRDAARAFADCA
jgi:hypothetical protein